MLFYVSNGKLGLGESQGISTYFSANCEESDADLASRFLNSINMSPYNTRLFKQPADNGTATRYQVLVSSAVSEPIPQKGFPFQSEYHFEGAIFEICLGDHSYEMQETVEALRQASGTYPCELFTRVGC